MEIINIPDWGTGTYRAAVSNQIKYIEIYDSNGKFISDAYTLQLTNYGQLVLEYENYEGASFPLMAVCFNTAEIEGGEGLFNKQMGAPFNSVRFGIGKRHEIARNVRFDELCKYVNDEGSIYVTKEFDGLNYATARQNLEVYSRQEVDNKIVGVNLTDAYTFTSPAVECYPFCREGWPNITRPALGNFTSTYSRGVMRIELSVTPHGVRTNSTGAYRLGSIQSIVGSSAFAPGNVVVAYPHVEGVPVYAHWMHRGTQESANNFRDLSTLPLLVMTTGNTKFANSNEMMASSIYMLNPFQYTEASDWIRFDNRGAETIKWVLEYYPNDEQLR